jgi:hypothetical protein
MVCGGVVQDHQDPGQRVLSGSRSKSTRRRCRIRVGEADELVNWEVDACERVGTRDTGGPVVGIHGWVDARWMTKTLRFWQKRSPNYDFYGRSTFLVITQPDGWVRREG